MAYKIGDFVFNTEEEAQEAKKEVQAIQYIMKQIDREDPKALLNVYQQMIQKDMFHTILGLAFLSDVREKLLASEEIAPENIPDLPQKNESEEVDDKESLEYDRKEGAAGISSRMEDGIRSGKQQDPEEKKDCIKKGDRDSKGMARVYKKRCQVLSFLCITMFCIIVGMFAISLTNQNPTILDYEEKLINKYAGWEEELNQREKELAEREEALKN